MRRKKLANYYVLLGAPLALGIPFLLNAYYPKELLLATKFSIWFLIAAIITLITSAGKKRIDTLDTKAKPLDTVSWLLSIASLITLSFLLFFGQGITLLHQAITQSQISAQQATQLLAHSIKTMNINIALFPGSLIATLSVSFFIRLRRSETTQPYSQFLDKMPFKPFRNTIKKTTSGYIETATRIFVFLSIMCFIAQLSLSAGINKNIMFANLIFMALFVLSYTKLIKKPDAFVKRHKPAPLLGFLFIIIVSFCTALLVNWGLNALLIHAGESTTTLPKASGNYLLVRQTTAMSWHLWSWSWWIIATPLLASVIVKISVGRTTREMSLAILGMTALIGVIFYSIPLHSLTTLAASFLNGRHAILLQLLPIIGLLYLFRLSSDNHTLWLGFVSLDPPKKIRAVSFKTTWIICAALFGAILMGNIQGALVAQMFAGIGCFIIYICSIAYR